jgi:hypothetical protein
MGQRHLERLRQARDLLAARGYERVILIGPDELYADPAAGGGRDGLR